MLTKADIRFVRALADRQARSESGMFVVEGDKMVAELPGSGLRTERLFTTGSSAVGGGEQVSDKEMERLSSLRSAPRSLAVVRIPERNPFVPSPEKLCLAIDGVQDPGNMGTIIRTADWFGIENIVCSADTADCYNPKAVQSTMGALFRVAVHYCDLPEWLAEARRGGTEIYGTTLDGEEIYEAELGQGGVIVMGNEGNGISDRVRRTLSRRLLIPPFPAGRRGSESLNVAIATAVVCAEFRRRTKIRQVL